MSLFDQTVAPYGLRGDDLADVCAASNIMKRMFEDNSQAPPQEEIFRERDRVAATLSTQPVAATERNRREAAELYQIGFVIDYLLWSKKQAEHPVVAANTTTQAANPQTRAERSDPLPSERFVGTPVGAALKLIGGYTMYGSTMHIQVYYLFSNGIATDCVTHELSTLPRSLPALRAFRDCTGARWRRSQGQIEIQGKDGQPWVVYEESFPQPTGTRLSFVGQSAGGSGALATPGTIAVNKVNRGTLTLTAEGRIRAVLSATTVVSGSNIGGYTDGTYSLDGTYTIDGFIMTINSGTGQTLRRLVTVVRESGGVYVYLDGKQFSQSR